MVFLQHFTLRYVCRLSGFMLHVHAGFSVRAILSLSPHPCLCIIGAVTLIQSLYCHVRAYLQQPVTRPSSRQTVSVARKTFTGLANGSRRRRGRVGEGRGGGEERQRGGGKEHLQQLVSPLSRFSTKNGTLFTFGNVERKRNGPKAAKDTPEEGTCESREGQI